MKVQILSSAPRLSEGLRPSDSPTRALARRFAGSLRPRGSLAALARGVTGLAPQTPPTRALARGARTCQAHCPIWVQGTLRGEPVRKSLDLRMLDAAARFTTRGRCRSGNCQRIRAMILLLQFSLSPCGTGKGRCNGAPLKYTTVYGVRPGTLPPCRQCGKTDGAVHCACGPPVVLLLSVVLVRLVLQELRVYRTTGRPGRAGLLAGMREHIAGAAARSGVLFVVWQIRSAVRSNP